MGAWTRNMSMVCCSLVHTHWAMSPQTSAIGVMVRWQDFDAQPIFQQVLHASKTLHKFPLCSGLFWRRETSDGVFWTTLIIMGQGKCPSPSLASTKCILTLPGLSKGSALTESRCCFTRIVEIPLLACLHMRGRKEGFATDSYLGPLSI